jgi:Ser/Thr protein kinase RdoA (MazF antagonist)
MTSDKTQSDDINTTTNQNESNNEDEILRKNLKPNPTEKQVIAVIKRIYGDEQVTILQHLESYDDCNYLVQIGPSDTDSQPTKYLAKFYNGVESAAFIKASVESHSKSSIHLHSSIFSHLNLPQYQVTTSLPRTNTSLPSSPSMKQVHLLPVVSESDSPIPLFVQLLHWIEGTPMSAINPLPLETIAQAGQYLGKTCHALDALSKENESARMAAKKYHAWDGRNTLDLTKFLMYIKDERRRSIVQSVLDSFREEFGDSVSGGGDKEEEMKSVFRMGILMGDYNDANIITDTNGNISGVIDFGDTVYSWRVLDISIAMAYAMLSSYGKCNRSISAAAAMLRGFHSIYPLTDIERKHLRLLMAIRLSCSVTLGAYSYSKNPENKYLLFHSEPAWKTLELIWMGVGGDGDGGKSSNDMASTLSHVFDVACDNYNASSTSLPIDCSDISFPDPNVPDLMKNIRVAR